MSIQRFRPDTLTEAHGFAHVVAATGQRTIITSGQVGVDRDGSLVGDGTDYRAQARQAHLNLYAALEAAGARPADIAKLTIYVVDPSEQNMNEAFAGIAEAAEGAGARSTATMLMGVTRLGLPGAVYEVDAIAVVD
jgi:enamine deaminase RidA (YjgF/YER057c/UK114 family)